MYRLIVSDLDGTLLDKDMNVSEENLEAIAQMDKNGVFFVPSSGRTLSEIPKALVENPHIRYIIHSNGAVIYDKVENRPIYRACIQNPLIRKIMDIIYSYDCFVTVRCDGEVYVDKNEQSKEKYEYYHVCAPHVEVVGTYGKFIENFEETFRNTDNIEVFAVFFRNLSDLEECKKKLQEAGGLIVAHCWDCNLEISSAAAGKGNTLAKLAELIGVPVPYTVAVGDSGNDITMLEKAGLGLAVKNASDDAKAVCDEIICSNDEHIAKYIYNYIVKENLS